MQSMVYHMIRHPDAWSRAREEIDRARKQNGICHDRIISYADAQKLPYLQACFKEALRMFHPVSMGTPRVVPRGGIMIGDRHFPAGTTVSLNTFSMNLSREVWGSDAQEYKPERWLVEDTTALDKKFLPVSCFHSWFFFCSTYINQFSGGIGVCVGQHLAKIEIFKVVATLVRDYDIEQVKPGQEWSYHAYFTVVPGDWPVHIKKTIA